MALGHHSSCLGGQMKWDKTWVVRNRSCSPVVVGDEAESPWGGSALPGSVGQTWGDGPQS